VCVCVRARARFLTCPVHWIDSDQNWQGHPVAPKMCSQQIKIWVPLPVHKVSKENM